MTELLLYSRNIVENWNFTNPNQSSWFETGGGSPIVSSWTIDSVLGNATHSPGTASTFYQDCLIPACEYVIRFTISNYTTGTLTLDAGGSAIVIASANGIFEYTATAAAERLAFTADSTFDGSLSLVSVRITPTVNSVDLVNQIQIPLTYNINDIKDIATRKGSFSKTIVIPGTKNNNTIFRHIYEIGSDNIFNPNKKITAVLLEDGVEIFNGILKLNKINRVKNNFDYDKISYEVTLSSVVVNIMDDLRGIYLTDLDFSEYNHYLTLANQQLSWSTTVQKNGSPYINWTSGIPRNIASVSSHSDNTLKITVTTPHGFVVEDQIDIATTSTQTPLDYYSGHHKVREVINSTEFTINMMWNSLYGNNLTGTVRKHRPKGEGYVYTQIDMGQQSVNVNTWSVPELTPCLYAYEIVKKIFKKIGVTYSATVGGTVFDQTFKRYVIPPDGKGFHLTQSEIAARDFKVGYTSDDLFSFTMKPNSLIANNYHGHRIAPIGGGSVPSLSGAATNPMGSTGNNSGAQGSMVADIKFNDETTAPYYDPNGEYKNTASSPYNPNNDYVWTCPANGNYDLNVDLILSLSNNLPAGQQFNPGQHFGLNSTPNIKVKIMRITGISPSSWVEVASDTYTAPLNLTDEHTFAVKILNNFFTAGEKYKVQYEVSSFYAYITDSSFNKYLTDFNWQIGVRAGAAFYTTFSNTSHVENELIDITNILPEKVTCADFIKSIISMFNLYIDSNRENPNELIIQTRDEFYANGSTIDWTQKLDISQDMILTPMGELAAKSYEFDYKQDGDYFNKKHEIEGNIIYGNYTKDIDNDFLTNTNKTEVIFSPSVIADMNSTSRPLTTIVGSKISPVQPQIDYNIRFLYYSLNSNGSVWYHYSPIDAWVAWYNSQPPIPSTVSGTFFGYNTSDNNAIGGTIVNGVVNITTNFFPFTWDGWYTVVANVAVSGYPGVTFNIYWYGNVSSHIWQSGIGGINSATLTTPPTPYTGTGYYTYPYAGHLDKACIGQIPTVDLNWNFPVKVYYNYNSWTDNNLYNHYYKRMIDEITDKNSKVIDAYIYLKPKDLYALDFRDRIFIDGHYLRLMKITDYQVGANNPTKCTFLKIENNPAFIPTHTILSNGQVTLLSGSIVLPVTVTDSLSPGSVGGGVNNKYTPTSKSLLVEGDNNTVGDFTKNITVLGDNNYIAGGLSNVTLINCNGLIITESNTTYINNVKIGVNLSAATSEINLIDSGIDNVLDPFNTSSTINFIDAGIDNILGLGSSILTNLIDSGQDNVV